MRIKQLDALRALAIFMVLGTHFGNVVADHTNWMPIWRQIGWSGVDLFFVLSGFLISGLLFREYKLSGNIRVGRFLAKRSIKLWPAYYTLVLATVAAAIYLGVPYKWSAIWPSIVFMQNYGFGGVIWDHLWSMAVEEHFYVLLPVVFWLAAKRNNPFDRLPQAACIVIVSCLVCRCIPVWHGGRHNFPMQSHLRFDGLAFGVLISYLWEFRPEFIQGIVRNRGRWLLGATVLLLSPQVFLSLDNPVMYTIGLTSTLLGCGGLLVYSIRCVRPDNLLIGCLAPVGIYSYTIYLVHVPVLVWTLHHGYSTNWRIHIAFFLYLSLSVVIGILFAKVLKLPVFLLSCRPLHIPNEPSPIIGH
jgi:peptidoglycan/LPS O-acetylase OafA/YrhL